MRSLAMELEKTIRVSNSEGEVLRRAKPLLAQLLASPRSIPEEAFKSREDRFAMNLIYMPEDKSFSINGAVWLPGQTTPIHDHLTWALVGI